MKKIIFILSFLFSIQLFYGQTSCFDAANKYQDRYLNETHIAFDSLLIYKKRAQEMIINCTIPNDTFITVKNIQSHIDKYKGKILIIDFWSIYCPPCINEIPSFHSLMKKYKKELNVLAFTLDSKKDILHYLQKNEFNAEIIADAISFVNKYSLGSGYPFTLLIDKAGKIIHVKNGGKSAPEYQLDLYNEFCPLIDAALQQK